MKNSLFLTVFLLSLFVSTAFALEPGDTLWTRTYGGAESEYAYSVEQTTDGGYIFCGKTHYYGQSDDSVYLVKTDANGDPLWTRTYGGYWYECGNSVQQTTDGGYIITGWTLSFGPGWSDVYLVKTDASGDVLWTRAHGGEDGDEEGWSVRQTTDGGYIFVGNADSFGAGGQDVYIFKTDANGDSVWARTYGGSSNDFARCVQQTTDGGYIVVGTTLSFGAGSFDIYLLKIDANGDTLWTRTYGGEGFDHGKSVLQIADGGYIIAGSTSSFGAGLSDVYLLKVDANGNTLWTRTYGGSDRDYGSSVHQTVDGGYIITGNTLSFGAGNYDVYVLKTDSNGDTVWTRTYGGSERDYGQSIQQTADGGYIAAGYTESFGAGRTDAWLLKLAGEVQPDVSIEIVPDDPPVTVPQGGTFGFTGTLTNNTDEPQVTDAWTMAVGPQKETYGPFKMLNDVELEPFETRTADFNQHVPNLAPLGFYTYIAYCGDYPSTVMDSSYFQIEVVAGEFTEAGQGGWVLTGSFLEGDLLDLPSEFALLSNYPNPFNARTVIEYQLPVSSSVKLEVYNILGSKVATLVNGEEVAGYKSVTWDASEVSSGVYFYKLTAAGFLDTNRMILLK